MSYEHRCRQCGKQLALADLQCPACGQAVPAEDRRQLLLDRAEGQAASGLYAEAARGLEGLLRQELPVDEARLLWRKRGAWLQRSGRPELMDAAEAALAESLRLDDNDDLSHQLWIDLLGKRGQLDKARAWYAQRLQLRPDDAMAQRQLTVIKLSADFKSAPRPTLELGPAPKSLFSRALKPTPVKAGTMALGLLVNGIMLLRALFTTPAGVRGDESSGVEQFASVLSLLNDPWLPGIQVVVCAAYLIWAWKELRG
jgi:tetratricopeptide (TPR) repeat protein